MKKQRAGIIAGVSVLVTMLFALLVGAWLDIRIRELVLAPFCSLRKAHIIASQQVIGSQVAFVKTQETPQTISARSTDRGCQFLEAGGKAFTYNLVVNDNLIGPLNVNLFATRGEKAINVDTILKEQIVFDSLKNRPANAALDIAVTGNYILFKQFGYYNNDGQSCSNPEYITNILSSTVCLAALDWKGGDYPQDIFPFLYIFKIGKANEFPDGFILTLPKGPQNQHIAAARTCWKGVDIRVESSTLVIPFTACMPGEQPNTKTLIVDLEKKQLQSGSLVE